MKNRKGNLYIEYILTFIAAGLAIIIGIYFVSSAASVASEKSNTIKKESAPCLGVLESDDKTSCF